MAVIKPFSDIVDALSKLRVLIYELAGDVSKLSDYRFRKELRARLREIRFGDDGTLQPLIAYLQSGDRSDLDGLRGHLAMSTAKTRSSVVELKSMTDRIADTNVHIEVRLLALLSNKFGPRGIRVAVGSLVERGVIQSLEEPTLYGQVEEIVSMIRQFNQEVNDLHMQLQD